MASLSFSESIVSKPFKREALKMLSVHRISMGLDTLHNYSDTLIHSRCQDALTYDVGVAIKFPHMDIEILHMHQLLLEMSLCT